MSPLQFLYRVIPSVLHIHVVWSTWTCIQPAGASLAALPSWDDIRYVHRLRLHVNGLRSRHHSRLVNTWFMHCGWLICYLHFLAVCHIWNVNPHSKFIGLTMPVTYTRQTISTNLCGLRDRSPICRDFHVFPRIVFRQDRSRLHLFPTVWHQTLVASWQPIQGNFIHVLAMG